MDNDPRGSPIIADMSGTGGIQTRLGMLGLLAALAAGLAVCVYGLYEACAGRTGTASIPTYAAVYATLAVVLLGLLIGFAVVLVRKWREWPWYDRCGDTVE